MHNNCFLALLAEAMPLAGGAFAFPFDLRPRSQFLSKVLFIFRSLSSFHEKLVNIDEGYTRSLLHQGHDGGGGWGGTDPTCGSFAVLPRPSVDVSAAERFSACRLAFAMFAFRSCRVCLTAAKRAA